MSRISRQSLYMQIAQLVSKRGTCDRARVGAVIVDREGNIQSIGYNGAPAGMPHCDEVGHDIVLEQCIRATHAEQNAILHVARNGGRGIVGSTMYSTHFPCPTCAKLIVSSGIVRLYYVLPYHADLHDYSAKLMDAIDVFKLSESD